MRILVSGSSGLVGSVLVPALTQAAYQVTRLVRETPRSEDEIHWDPANNTIDAKKLEGIDAVVHLAGESIAAGKWNAERKSRIRSSRIQGTRLLASAVAQLSQTPKAFLCASASGYYGNREAELLTEESGSGTGFLAEVAREWEAACEPAAQKNIRVVNLRFGIILSLKGGALAKMLPPFKLGLGGRLGSGDQYWSWLTVEEVAGVILHALRTESLQGPVNTVTPNPVTNSEFTAALARILKRPAILPVPAIVLRTAMGEMADELLLSSCRMEPAKLIVSGYAFRHPELEGALRYLLT